MNKKLVIGILAHVDAGKQRFQKACYIKVEVFESWGVLIKEMLFRYIST